MRAAPAAGAARGTDPEVRPGGRLVVCPTPLGNLGDITLRALEALRGADVVFAEDTRRTAKLMSRHALRVPLVSCHEHNEAARAAEAVQRVLAGETVVLVSDAGSPGIADPGQRVVAAALEAGLAVTALPGPSAVPLAVVLAGFPVRSFTFLGFLPRRPGERDRLLADALAGPHAVVCFESPRRLGQALASAAQACGGDRRAAVARELTKLHEEVRRGTLAELAEAYGAAPPRGEVTLVIAAAAARPAGCVEQAADEAANRIASGEDRRQVLRSVAARHGVRRRDLYRRIHRAEDDKP